jgi:antitoxin FitA
MSWGLSLFLNLADVEINDYNDCSTHRGLLMASITIRNLDPNLKQRLRVRAARHGRSMEAEARRILQTALTASERPPVQNLYERIRARFDPLGGIDLDLPPRDPAREPPRFE